MATGGGDEFGVAVGFGVGAGVGVAAGARGISAGGLIPNPCAVDGATSAVT